MAAGAPLPATHREGPVAGAPEHWPAGWPRHQDQLCALSVPRALLSPLSTWEGSWAPEGKRAASPSPPVSHLVINRGTEEHVSPSSEHGPDLPVRAWPRRRPARTWQGHQDGSTWGESRPPPLTYRT